MIEGRLKYDFDSDRYGLFGSKGFERSGFHCGETMEVLLDRKWVETRIEMDWSDSGQNWYLVGTPFYGNLENVTARIGG